MIVLWILGLIVGYVVIGGLIGGIALKLPDFCDEEGAVEVGLFWPVSLVVLIFYLAIESIRFLVGAIGGRSL